MKTPHASPSALIAAKATSRYAARSERRGSHHTGSPFRLRMRAEAVVGSMKTPFDQATSSTEQREVLQKVLQKLQPCLSAHACDGTPHTLTHASSTVRCARFNGVRNSALTPLFHAFVFSREVSSRRREREADGATCEDLDNCRAANGIS